MKAKKGIFQKIKRWWHEGVYMTNKDAAAIIKRFISGTGQEYEWDDFESVEHKNPDVDLAIKLCCFFAGKFPPEKSTEYCNRKADMYFLKIADALGSNDFSNLDYEAIKLSLKKGILPEKITTILEIKD